MKPNPAMKKLGLSDTDRAIILHADDIAYTQSSITAWQDLVEFGLMSSAAVMVPCAWFPGFVQAYKEQPADVGVHITLTSEWDVYRWGPISTRDPKSGLLDDEGYFPRDREVARAQADPDAALVEMRAQVQRAVDAGIDVTHIDTHMITIMHPRLIMQYVQVAKEFNVPPLMARWSGEKLGSLGYDADQAQAAEDLWVHMEAEGIPMVDHVDSLKVDVEGDPVEQAQAQIAKLEPGLTHFLFHPGADTPEVRALGPDWRRRLADYQAFMSDALRQSIKEAGIHIIGYRELRDLMRG